MKNLPPIDELIKMGKDNPELLEQLKKDLINDIIKDLPSDRKKKLIGLQNKIDLICKTSSNKFITSEKLYLMMMESFNDLNIKLNYLNNNNNNNNNNNKFKIIKSD